MKPEDRKKKVKTRTKKILRYSVFGFGFLILATLVSAQLTSTPSFCKSCHYMEPFYDAWIASSHSEVDCITCHYPPTWSAKIEGKFRGLIQLVNYVGQTYKRTKPWAEIPDESCLQSGCHETRLLEGVVQFQKVVFDHKHHLGTLKRGKDLRCTSCHSQIVQGDHMVVTESSCFLCHFKDKTPEEKQNSCETCHDWENVIQNETMDDHSYDHTNIHRTQKKCTLCHTNVIVGDGYVPLENCYQCHFEREHLNQYSNIDLVHLKHISENKIECENCHLAIQHKIQRLTSAEGLQECTTCHTNLHQAQLDLFTGTGGIDVVQHPNPMDEIGLNCKGCHIFHEESGIKGELEGQTDLAEAKSCESCHGTGYNRILQNWQEVTDSHLKQINGVMAQVKQASGKIKNSIEKKTLAEQLLNDATFNIEIVTAGKSVHNIKYSDDLIHTAYDKIIEAADILGIPYTAIELQDHESLVPSECSNCHFGIEEKERDIYGLVFKHEVHVAENKFKCNLCHSNTKRHGELAMSRQSCASCHHTNESVDCQQCHTLQTSLIAGSPSFYDTEIEGVMTVLGEDCLLCHEVEEKQIKRPVGETCVGCHDEGYDDLLYEWRNEAVTLIKALETALDERIRQPGDLDPAQLETMREWVNQFRLDGSNSVHNRELFEDAMERIQNYIQVRVEIKLSEKGQSQNPEIQHKSGG